MSLSPVQAEIKALVALLEQDWPSSEDLAKALIVALDEARAKRKTHTAVMQFGPKENSPTVFYVGIGPFAGVASARNAVMKFPAASMATKIVVIPVMNEEGMNALIKEVG